MEATYLQSVAARKADWLEARQMLVASNLANANVPGFKALDLKPFDMQDTFRIEMARTHGAHRSPGIAGAMGVGVQGAGSFEMYHSGGNVSTVSETMKSAEVVSEFQLNTAVMKKFHSMLLSVFAS